MTNPNTENGQGDSALQILSQITQDWREYLIGVGNNFPPNEEEYRTFFERMTANIDGAESLAHGRKFPVLES
jgi:hypothetical protein